MYTKVFNNEQEAIKAVQEGRYEYVHYEYVLPDDSYIIETKIENPYNWVSSSSVDFLV